MGFAREMGMCEPGCQSETITDRHLCANLTGNGEKVIDSARQ
jgi:hypothetical protein